MRLLAIDPGNEQSAYVVYDVFGAKPLHWEKVENERMLRFLDTVPADVLAVEMVASYGMPVGKDIFETCVWIGRFVERWLRYPRAEPLMVYRKDVKWHLCSSLKAKDSNVRQALIDRYGPGKDKTIGRKATPGPLYGLSGDCWAALAVAVTASETTLAEQLEDRRAA